MTHLRRYAPAIVIALLAIVYAAGWTGDEITAIWLPLLAWAIVLHFLEATDEQHR